MVAVDNICSSPPLVVSKNREHDDDSTTSDVTWPEIDGHVGEQLAEIHGPGYSHSPIPSMVTCCAQHDHEGKTDHADDRSQDYINEIVELKLQLANRQAEVDELMARLNRYALENETLQAEKSALVDEIAQYRHRPLDTSTHSASSSLRSSFLSIGRKQSEHQGRNGSIRMLLDTNSKLLRQTSRLKVENNALRKSLQSNIWEHMQKSREEKDNVELQIAHKRTSFATNKTANETLSVSSPMPDHWPALNDPYLDDLGSGSHASSAGAGEEKYSEEIMPSAAAREVHTTDQSPDVNAEEQVLDDINLFGIENTLAYVIYPTFKRSFTLGKRHSHPV